MFRLSRSFSSKLGLEPITDKAFDHILFQRSSFEVQEALAHQGFSVFQAASFSLDAVHEMVDDLIEKLFQKLVTEKALKVFEAATFVDEVQISLRDVAL